MKSSGAHARNASIRRRSAAIQVLQNSLRQNPSPLLPGPPKLSFWPKSVDGPTYVKQARMGTELAKMRELPPETRMKIHSSRSLTLANIVGEKE